MNRRQLLTLATLFAVVFALPLTGTFGAEKKAKVLYFSRSQGFEHAPVKLLEDGTTVSDVALKKYCAAKNIELVCTQDGGVFDGDLGQYDAFVFYTSGNLEAKQNPDRKNAVSPISAPISTDGLKKFFAAVKSGKGLVGIHAATDSHCSLKDENGVDLYTKLIGARFASHGPMQDATVSIVKPVQIPWLKDKGDKYTVREEWYAMKDYNTDMHVFLVQETAGMNGKCYDRPNFPSSWIRMEEKGRVAYSAFGHENKFWEDDENVRKIGELIEWSIGRFDVDTTPNFNTVTPKGNELPK